jgi:hypothetical protein
MATKQQVLDLYAKNPKLNSMQIADILDCGSEYVRATFYREGLTLPGASRSKSKKRKLIPRKAA